MNTDLITVFGFALIVLFAFVLPIVIYGIRSGHKLNMAELMAEGEGARVDSLGAELVEVKKRLAVIECIVTDARYDLDREIRRLESV